MEIKVKIRTERDGSLAARPLLSLYSLVLPPSHFHGLVVYSLTAFPSGYNSGF